MGSKILKTVQVDGQEGILHTDSVLLTSNLTESAYSITQVRTEFLAVSMDRHIELFAVKNLRLLKKIPTGCPLQFMIPAGSN